MSDYFADLIETLGEPRFNGVLYESLRAIAEVDHVVLVRHPEYVTKTERPSIALTMGTLKDSLADEFGAVYEDGMYASDPHYRYLRQYRSDLPARLVHTNFADHREARWRDIAHDRCRFLEKLSIVSRKNKSAYCLSLYRHVDTGPFVSAHVNALRSHCGLIDSLIAKHIQFSSNPSIVFSVERVEEVFERKCEGVLTPREISVCARILCGYTSKHIARDLNISTNTVYTFRRLAYDKLGVHGHEELYGAVIAN